MSINQLPCLMANSPIAHPWHLVESDTVQGCNHQPVKETYKARSLKQMVKTKGEYLC